MRAAVFVCVLVALCAGVQAAAARRQLAQTDAATCRNLFNLVGGLNGLTAFMPSCTPGASYNAEQCCQQAKAALNLAPQAAPCLCVAEVWGEVRSQASTAGYDNRLVSFLPSCGIKTAGNGC